MKGSKDESGSAQSHEWLRPKPPVREGSSGARFQVLLKLRRLLPAGECDIGPKNPRAELRGVRDCSVVVL